MRSLEQEAGLLYEEGAKAVSAGGHQLSMLAGHLIFMVRGTQEFKCRLWPVRILHDGTEKRLDRFEDYLRKPAREGLGLPSFHFLRQVLKASPKGKEALVLVRSELAKEHVDFDAVADQEDAAELLKGKVGPEGRPSGKKPTPGVGLSTGGTDRRAAQLAARRPDLAQAVRDGRMKLAAALIEAGIRKKPVKLTHCPHCGREL